MLTESLLRRRHRRRARHRRSPTRRIDWLSATVRNLDNPPPSWITFDIDAPGAGVHGARDARSRRSSPACCRPGCRRAPNAVDVLRDGGRGNTSRSVEPGHARPGRVPDRRHLRAADRLAAAAALDPQPADDRLRLRHRRHHVGAHGPDGRRLSVAGGAQGCSTTGCCASCAANPEFEAVALTNRFRMVFSGNGPIEIEGKTYAREARPAERELRAGHRRLLRRHRPEAARRPHASPTTTSTRGSRWRSSTPPSRGSTSAPRARSAAASAPSTATRQQPGPWRTIVGVVSTVRMLGPFNNPERGRDRLLRAVLLERRSARCQPSRSSSQFATVVVKPRGGQRADALATPLRREVAQGGPEPAALFRRHAEEPARRLRRAEPHHRHDVHDLRRGGGGARRRSGSTA